MDSELEESLNKLEIDFNSMMAISVQEELTAIVPNYFRRGEAYYKLRLLYTSSNNKNVRSRVANILGYTNLRIKTHEFLLKLIWYSLKRVGN